ncbi:MAG: DUF373 family protein [Methanoregulaceae archaeon]|nr:DUF373 family protein [Methanoregulaceae archaeon]
MMTGRTLVLAVDRDDDIGFKAKIESPVIGRTDCLRAATSLGLADPEDSDVNAIFEAIKIYDELLKKGEDVEVAVIAGNHLHMIEGDRRIAEALEEVVKQTKTTGCVVVSDGAEDEFVVPIIQSKIQVTSIRRVIVSQIPNLEGTYYIIKKLLNDPKISRLVMVPLGLAMLLYAVAYLLGYPNAATITVIGVVGIYLLYRGAGIDEIMRDFIGALQTSMKRARFSFVTYIAGLVLVVIGIVLGLMSILQYYSDGNLGLLLYLLSFFYGGALWMMFGGIVATIGVVIDNFLYEREGLAKVIVYPFYLGAIGLITYAASTYILSYADVPDFPVLPESALSAIAIWMVGGFVCAFAGVGFQYLVGKWVQNHTAEPIIDVV